MSLEIDQIPGSNIKPGSLPASALKPASVGSGLLLGGGVLRVNPLVFDPFQKRVTGTCPAGEAISAIAQSGSATCVSVGTGTAGVDSITAGDGLSEDQSTGNVTLSLSNPLSMSGSSSQAILAGANTGAGDGVHGETSGDGYSGVSGLNTNTSPTKASYGGYFASAATGSYGVGVFGSTSAGKGVWGGSGSGTGVEGDSNGGIGVDGVNTGAGDGVQGQTGDAGSSGVYGNNTGTGKGVFGHSNGGTGVEGDSFGGTAVFGYNSGAGNGVYGKTTDAGYSGVFGSNISSGRGVFGHSNGGPGVAGNSTTGYGVLANSAGNDAIHGVTSAPGYSGVYGTNTSGSGYAGWFQGNVNITGNLHVGGTVTSDQGGAWWAIANKPVGIIDDGARHVLVSIALPAGMYTLSAKTTVFDTNNTGTADCYLTRTADGYDVDQSEAGVHGSVVPWFETIPLVGIVNAGAHGTTVSLSCATSTNGNYGLEAELSKIVATSVGALHS